MLTLLPSRYKSNRTYDYTMLAVRWGLIPPWSKDEKVGYKLINAQAESLREKPTFRDVFVLAILAAHKNV